jgi:hypothetical protein
VHLNIAPSGNICTAGLDNKINTSCTTAGANIAECGQAGNCSGPTGSKTCKNSNAPVTSCTTDSDCNLVGTCASALECSGATNVFVKGTDNTACTDTSQCTGTGETECDTSVGFCKFIDAITATVTNNQIDVCYTVRGNMCQTGVVAYCGDSPGAYLANQGAIPPGTQTNGPAGLRAVEADSGVCSQGGNSCSTDADCTGGTHDKCEYTVVDCSIPLLTCNDGAVCCGLTQGAYGSAGGVANAAGTGVCGDPNNPLVDAGYITAAICAGDDPFNGGASPNDTTIGETGRSVTLLDQKTLIAYLPASGTASSLSSSTGVRNYSGGTITPPSGNVSGSGSKGNGAGVLAGNTLACQLNAFLSDSGFAPGGFSDFTVPSSLFCTRRSGSDKTVDTSDDICQGFSYPSCAAGLSVSDLLTCANEVLGGSSTPSCTCSAKDLNIALDNINNQFDQCGHAIDCGTQTTAGVFTCPSL